MSKKTVFNKRPGLAKVSEAAHYLSVSRGHLYKMIQQGEDVVPVKRIGAALRIPWSWVLKQAREEEDQHCNSGGET